ncbi:MAG: hypothetical protein AB7G39_06485 [Alphaproteobacteria bacterium]
MNSRILKTAAIGLVATGLLAGAAGAGDSTAVRLTAPRIALDTVVPARAAASDGTPDLPVLATTPSMRVGELLPGDLLRIDAGNGRTTAYRVADIRIVHRDQPWAAAPSAHPQVALVSDMPEDPMLPGNPLRFVVIAEAETASLPLLASR